MMKRTSTLSRSILSALRLMDLGKGKSVSQIGSEYELSNSDVVCVLMPFVRAGLAGRRTVTEDWRDDIYYSLNYEREVPPAHTEERLRKLKDEVAKSKSELRSLQGEVARKEESIGKARHLDSTKDFQLGEGKSLAQIGSETGMSLAKIQQLLEPLVKSGDVVQKYISQGQFYYVPAKKLRDFIPNVTEEEIKKLKTEIRRLKNAVLEKEETIRREVKLAVLQSLDVGKGKSAGQIAAKMGMSIADVIGTMMTFVRSGLIEQSFTPQGFYYTPPTLPKETIPAAMEERRPAIPMRPTEEIVVKQVARELVTPSETRAGVQLFTAAETHTRIELFEPLLPKLTVRELVLLREKINMELRKR
jgi:DNA-binding MarR family transcriptional regulator